jgi:hypothetical protein
MIIVLCWDDPQVREAAETASYNFPEVWGEVHRIDLDPKNLANTINAVSELPRLQRGERLMFTGHAMLDPQTGASEIGNEADNFGLSGRELYENFKAIIPDGWGGTVYVDGCQSADRPLDGGFSLAENFKSAIEGLRPGEAVDVFGRLGAASMEIPPFESELWKKASFG